MLPGQQCAGNSAQAIVRICKCHVMWFGPVACRYFVLRYNNRFCSLCVKLCTRYRTHCRLTVLVIFSSH